MSNIIKAIQEIYPNINGGFAYWETKQDGSPLDNPIDGLKWENTEFPKPSWADIESKFSKVELDAKKDEKIQLCRQFLTDSDWYSQRHADTGQPYPEEVRQKRADARSIQDSIKAATTVAELDAIDLSAFVL